MKVLELFAGTRSIGRQFEKRGHEVLSVDWDKDFDNAGACRLYPAKGNVDEKVCVYRSVNEAAKKEWWDPQTIRNNIRRKLVRDCVRFECVQEVLYAHRSGN